MPREGFSRKPASRTGSSRGEHGKAAWNRGDDFIVMSPDEPTPAMQNPEKWTTGVERGGNRR